MSLIENPPGVYFPFRCCSYELKKSLSEESCCLVLHHSLIKFAWYQDSLVHTVCIIHVHRMTIEEDNNMLLTFSSMVSINRGGRGDCPI